MSGLLSDWLNLKGDTPFDRFTDFVERGVQWLNPYHEEDPFATPEPTNNPDALTNDQTAAYRQAFGNRPPSSLSPTVQGIFEDASKSGGMSADELLRLIAENNRSSANSAAAAAAARDAAARRRIQEMYASMLGTLNTNVGVARGQVTSTSEDLMRKLTALRDRSQRESAAAARQLQAMYGEGISDMGRSFDSELAGMQGAGVAEMRQLRREQMGLLQGDALRSRALMGGNNNVLNGLMNGRVATGQTLGTASLQQLSNAQVQAAAALDRQRLQALAQYGG